MKAALICKACGKTNNLDAITGIDWQTMMPIMKPDRDPRPGDLSVCVWCGAPGRVDNRMKYMVPISPGDLTKLDPDDFIFVTKTSLTIKKLHADINMGEELLRMIGLGRN